MSETLPNPEFRDRAAFLLAGTVRTYAHGEGPKLIPMQWGDFFALDVPEIHAAEVTYGAVTGSNAESMDYMVAIEVPNFNGISAPHTETIPAAHYAVFTIDGLAHVAQNWADAYTKWLPASGYKRGTTPAFERYDARFDGETASGPWELWISIERVTI